MAKTIHNKLVRDRIPAILAEKSVLYAVEKMEPSDYVQALRGKVVEEAFEVEAASREDLLNELADIYEVLDSLKRASQITDDEIRLTRTRKNADRGAFDDRIKLLWTED